MRNRGAERTSGGNEVENEDLTRLLKQLRIAYRQAGEPPYRDLAALTRLSASTISRIFNATKPPKYRNLQRVLVALGVLTSEHRTTWYPLWYQAVNRVRPLDEPTNTPPADLDSQGLDTGCSQCGAAVVDAELHAKWHTRLGRSEHLVEGLERRTRQLGQLAVRTAPQPPDRDARTRRAEGAAGTQPPAPPATVHQRGREAHHDHT
jgi:transcriptional regulator with XRE-family HTH domain